MFIINIVLLIRAAALASSKWDTCDGALPWFCGRPIPPNFLIWTTSIFFSLLLLFFVLAFLSERHYYIHPSRVFRKAIKMNFLCRHGPEQSGMSCASSDCYFFFLTNVISENRYKAQIGSSPVCGSTHHPTTSLYFLVEAKSSSSFFLLL